VRALDRRLARLEAMREHLDDLVGPEQLRRMAAIVLDNPLDVKLRAEAERLVAQPIGDVDAERARVREKLLGDGPHVPAGDRPKVDSDAARILRQKLLRDDVLPAAGPARL
jgi:hypothetical protein